MKNKTCRIEQAVKRAGYELAQEVEEPMPMIASLVFFNALSDVTIRAGEAGIAERDSLDHYLRFSRRVCELLEGETGGYLSDFQ